MHVYIAVSTYETGRRLLKFFLIEEHCKKFIEEWNSDEQTKEIPAHLECHYVEDN
ncbi:MAG: hypothetical protein ACTSU2_02400 [Promethearchaeota archaeon]